MLSASVACLFVHHGDDIVYKMQFVLGKACPLHHQEAFPFHAGNFLAINLKCTLIPSFLSFHHSHFCSLKWLRHFTRWQLLSNNSVLRSFFRADALLSEYSLEPSPRQPTLLPPRFFSNSHASRPGAELLRQSLPQYKELFPYLAFGYHKGNSA